MSGYKYMPTSCGIRGTETDPDYCCYNMLKLGGSRRKACRSTVFVANVIKANQGGIASGVRLQTSIWMLGHKQEQKVHKTAYHLFSVVEAGRCRLVFASWLTVTASCAWQARVGKRHTVSMLDPASAGNGFCDQVLTSSICPLHNGSEAFKQTPLYMWRAEHRVMLWEEQPSCLNCLPGCTCARSIRV